MPQILVANVIFAARLQSLDFVKNYVAKVQIFPELAKFCARRMQLNLFKTAEPQPKFSEAKFFSDYFRKKCRVINLKTADF